jgi:glutamate dehydrogenase/leucine dehydrogenase
MVAQGSGNGGSAAALLLARGGAKVVGIIDRVGGLTNEDGFFEEISTGSLNKDAHQSS